MDSWAVISVSQIDLFWGEPKEHCGLAIGTCPQHRWYGMCERSPIAGYVCSIVTTLSQKLWHSMCHSMNILRSNEAAIYWRTNVDAILQLPSWILNLPRSRRGRQHAVNLLTTVVSLLTLELKLKAWHMTWIVRGFSPKSGKELFYMLSSGAQYDKYRG